MFGNHVSKKLSAYCHGELAPDESRRLAEHLMNCQRCRKEYEEIRFGAQMASRLSPQQAPPTLWSELELMLNEAEVAGSAATVQRSSAVKSPRRWFALQPALITGAALMLIITGSVWYYLRMSRPAWEVTNLEGQPKIGSRIISAVGRMGIGEWLVTDEASRARITVGEIGQVQVEPNSQIKLVEARVTEHRLSLQRGKMHAFIWAPPRLFYVDTPSAVAVDLGCAYTLEVDDDGQGLLLVTSGWVAFEQDGRESFVPREAMCVTRPGFGPGTPYYNDAADDFKTALAKFDTTKAGEATRAEALDVVLKQARERDALTLWHLLARAGEYERGLVYDKLAALIPPPPAVTRAGIERGDKAMRDLWWEKLDLGSASWWRIWKGPVPNR